MLRIRRLLGIALAALALTGVPVTRATAGQAPGEPQIGQPGKDVIWVPTSPELMEKMFDLARVTARDYVVDLGSGDGRMVIGAALRGARALGVEYDPLLVTRSREAAARAGVADRARFVRGDMYTTPFGRPTALTLFLLPSNLIRLRDRLLALAPGTRIVVNTYGIPDWRHDAEVSLDLCDPWCTARLWVVPARVDGAWETAEGTLTFAQRFQDIAGTLSAATGQLPLTGGRLDGDRISFRIGPRAVSATVRGGVMRGVVTFEGRETAWHATRRGAVPRPSAGPSSTPPGHP
ncbi:MAG: class I SAM-dependent methyltransferase [Vicinamibacterales bacterium]